MSVMDLPKPLQRLSCDMTTAEGSSSLQRELRLPSHNPALQKVSEVAAVLVLAPRVAVGCVLSCSCF